MAREAIITCEHVGCEFVQRGLVGEELPARCPLCKRSGRWRVEPVEIHFTYNDRKLLASLRIAPE